VNASDSLGARSHESPGPVPITNQWDYNRDGAVNSTDVTIAQQNGTSGASALQLITVPAVAPAAAIAVLHDAVLASAVSESTEATAWDTLVNALTPDTTLATVIVKQPAPPVGALGNRVVSALSVMATSASQATAATTKSAVGPTAQHEYIDAVLDALNDEFLRIPLRLNEPLKKSKIFLGI